MLSYRQWALLILSAHDSKMAVAYTKHCLICSVINVFILFITVLNGEDVPLFKIETEIYSSVVLPCPGKSQQNRWKHKDRNLFVRRANIGKLPKESVGLSQDYSLLIYNVTLLHDGTYQCFRNSVISVNYSLFVTGKYSPLETKFLLSEYLFKSGT